MYTLTSRIRYSEIDETGRLSVPAAINYLQDASILHAQDVGRGLAHMRDAGNAWMLAAWKIEIRSLPAIGQTIRVRTWPTGFKGVLSRRNFTIHTVDAAGADTHEVDEEPCLRADSLWFLYDAATGRPCRLCDDHLAPFRGQGDFEPALDMDAPQRRIRLPKDVEPAAATPVHVTTAHIDTNHHVNNAQYVSMALDALLEYPPAQSSLQAFAARSDNSSLTIDVCYSAAATRGQTIYPRIYQTGAGTAAAGFIVSLDDEAARHFAIVQIAKRPAR